jgi:hypothetical protein
MRITMKKVELLRNSRKLSKERPVVFVWNEIFIFNIYSLLFRYIFLITHTHTAFTLYILARIIIHFFLKDSPACFFFEKKRYDCDILFSRRFVSTLKT